MSEEAINKSTQRLVKAIGDAAQARVTAEAHMRDQDSFQFASDHRRAVEAAKGCLEAAIASAAEHLREGKTTPG